MKNWRACKIEKNLLQQYCLLPRWISSQNCLYSKRKGRRRIEREKFRGRPPPTPVTARVHIGYNYVGLVSPWTTFSDEQSSVLTCLCNGTCMFQKTGELSLAIFPVTETERLVTFIQQECHVKRAAAHDVPVIYTTGIHVHRVQEKLETALNVRWETLKVVISATSAQHLYSLYPDGMHCL